MNFSHLRIGINPVIKNADVHEILICAHFRQPLSFDGKIEICLDLGDMNNECY